MAREKLNGIVIEDEDIDWVESIMGEGFHFDVARRTIIKNLDSVDIQAFPGSGKTTTLVAKLAILAKKWPFSNSGICVLSHTNVAREEIEERLGNTEIGKKLLSYPHFVGTLHSFFDSYVSLPWLRSKGIRLNMIDTNLVLTERWNSLPYKTKEYLKHQLRDQSICEYKESVGVINWDKKGETGGKILKAIQHSQERGNFTFHEMLLYAKEALTKCNCLSSAIQTKFPLLFIDEAQDTNAFQWSLLHRAFSGDGELSIYQGYGDSNQAIYNYINESVDDPGFPRDNPLLLCESRRFDSRISKLANTVALSSAEMTGTNNPFSDRACCHTIYLFTKEKAEKVIEEFGQLLLDTFTDEELHLYKKNGCHVIGMVHDKKEETQANHFPKGIYDYWPCYEAHKSNKNETPKTLLEYFRKGKMEFHLTNETASLAEWFSKGLRRLINKAKNDNYISVTSNIISGLNRALSEEKQLIFRKLLSQLMLADISSKENWEGLSQQIEEILDLFDAAGNENTKKFMTWSADELICKPDNEIKDIIPNNSLIYRSEKDGRYIELAFGSIHSVKGRTHLATLVLETFSRKHNMKAIIKYLCNTPPKASSSNQNRLKCQYVAMTRAKGLLCLAIPKEFIDPKDRAKLIDLGWNLQIIE